MKYLSFLRPNGTASYGRLENDIVYDLKTADAPWDLKTAIANNALTTLDTHETFAYSQVTLLPVIPNPNKIFCVGHNYESHRKETGRDEVANPSIFIRFADSLTAHKSEILIPNVSTSLDYEGELAVIIGKGGRAIAEAEAMNHVAGYACFNDASIRDWQWHTRQFTPGKNFPTTGPFGPYMVTPDEAGNLEHVHVITRLNGEVMQDQPIGDMIFPIAEIIAYVSAFTPLSPGDVIVSGTPGGVGAKRTPPVWMKPGEIVEVEIGPMGTLTNTIGQE
ncbi:MAG: fumarylacetoacetate hydrolase family protein [Gammaproteobacteria bacterium]|nr:fumarylacetoacetate hydrolase family protein [Gammaproteobacteria bacterium]